MVDVTQTFEMALPPAVVLDYLQDFAHAPEWDPGTKQCVRVGDGPTEAGSRWPNISRELERLGDGPDTRADDTRPGPVATMIAADPVAHHPHVGSSPH